MSYENLRLEDSLNQALEPVLMQAIDRFRALLPSEVELALDLSHDNPRVRAHAQPLEDAILSACMVAWQSMAGLATQILVEMRVVLLDDVVLDLDAEKLQGGIPPRSYVWLVITNSSRATAGPFHSLVPPPRQTDDRPASARRLRVPEMRHVIDQHHGWMTAMPEPEKGTAFDIYLPTVLPLEIQALNASGSDIKHIIYVDDYEPMRALISETLPDAGFDVTCYESGKDAIAAFLANPFQCDAIVSDYRLQGFSGLDLLRKIKPVRPDLLMIIISGYVDDALKSKAMDEGALLVISKTHDLNELCVELRHLLGAAPNPALVNYSEWASL